MNPEQWLERSTMDELDQWVPCVYGCGYEATLREVIQHQIDKHVTPVETMIRELKEENSRHG